MASIRVSSIGRPGASRTLERGGRGAGHQLGLRHRCQLDEPHPVAGAIEGIGRHLQRQPGLADPARTRDRDQPRPARHQRAQLGQFRGPAHEAGCLRWQVVAQRRVVKRAQRAELLGQARSGHLEDPLGTPQVPQALLAQVPEPDPAGQPAGEQRVRRRRHQDLTAMADVEQPGGPVHHRTDVVPVALRAGTRMQRHAHPNGQAGRPGLGVDSPLDGHRRRKRGNRVGEHRAMRLAHRLEDAAAARLDLLADNSVMAGRRRRHGIAVGLPQPDAALDIGEQQRH